MWRALSCQGMCLRQICSDACCLHTQHSDDDAPLLDLHKKKAKKASSEDDDADFVPGE